MSPHRWDPVGGPALARDTTGIGVRRDRGLKGQRRGHRRKDSHGDDLGLSVVAGPVNQQQDSADQDSSGEGGEETGHAIRP